MKENNKFFEAVKTIATVAGVSWVLYTSATEEYYGIFYPMIVVLTLLLGAVVWATLRAKINIREKRRQGIYPQKGQTTMDDVKRLALSGQEDLALRAYFEIKKDTLEGARRKIQYFIDEKRKKARIEKA